MIFPGHMGAAYLTAHYAKLDERVALVAAFLPDAIDKPTRYILHLTPNARIPAHSLLVGLLTTCLVLLVLRRRLYVLSWAAGYASHLLGDLLIDVLHGNGPPLYLFWPLVPGETSDIHTMFGSFSDYRMWGLGLEATLTLWALIVFVRALRRRKARGRLAMRPVRASARQGTPRDPS